MSGSDTNGDDETASGKSCKAAFEAGSEDPPHEAVGYCQPPRAHRFRPGQSGNPRGRPKGARSTGSIVAGVLSKKVTLNTAGRRRQVPVKEAILMRMADAALKGDLKAAAAVLALEERLVPALESMEPAACDPEDDLVIASFLARRGSGGEA